MSSNNLVLSDSSTDLYDSKVADMKQFVTMEIDGQLFGIPVITVQDILRDQSITNIPMSKREIRGAINLRGRIVTVVDMRTRLGLKELDLTKDSKHVVIDYKDEQYSFLVDEVGEVLSLSLNDFENNPANLAPNWQEVSLGVYRLESRLLLILNIESLLKF